MANKELLNLSIDICCNVLPAIKSNHSLLLTKVNSRNEFIAKRPFIFRYEMACEVRDECSNINSKVWPRG